MTTSTNLENNIENSIETETEIVCCEYEETSSIKASSTNLHEFERVNQKEGAFLFKTIVPTITTLSIVIIWLIIFII